MGAYKKDDHNFPSTQPACGGQLADFCLARELYAYGNTTDYFDYQSCIGWVRAGTHDRRDGCALIMSNGDDAWKKMRIGQRHAGEVWTDVVSACSLRRLWRVRELMSR